jgi:eukaryotic-like serine/threonine-protein kinase
LSTPSSEDQLHWDELQRLFHLCDGVPLPDCEALLIQANADAGLRARVLELRGAVEAHDSAPAVERAVASFLGPYRLVRPIGSGGMGTVYLAERLTDGATLRSALKILAQHAVDGSFLERFHREQQHLATLSHPHITQLLDAGWSEQGQPYLVMEYVDGLALDAYCTLHQLRIDQRLRLFLQVCEAVSYAHRNLIVHLDLKPSNVLVTASGEVKLLDFGTSKLLRADGGSTMTVVATPAFASPEQLLGEPVSTACDVYGLGAILYTLLAGQAPFATSSTAGRLESIYRQVEPPSLTRSLSSTAAASCGLNEQRLRLSLRGDLSAIVATCLRPRPQDRYSSVEALGADIRRYLACEPVLAQRQTFRYRAGKLLRRQRLPIALAAAVLLTVAIVLSYAWWQQQQAVREASRAVRMQTFLYSLFRMANPNYTSKPIATVPEFLRAGMTKVPEFIHEPSDLRQAQLGLAESMYASGSLEDARAAFAQIMAIAVRPEARADRAEAESYAAAIEFEQGRVATGRTLAADALALARAGPTSARVRVLSEITFAYNEDGSGYQTDQNLRLLEAAVQESREQHLAPAEVALALRDLASDLDLRGRKLEAKGIFEQLLTVYAADPLALCQRSETYAWLAWIDDSQGDVASSLPLFRQAYEGYVACTGPESRGALEQLPYWADALIKSGRPADAVAMLEPALPAWRRVEGNNPDSAGMLYFLARGYDATLEYAKAEALARELLNLLTGKIAPTDRSIGMAHMVLAEALAGQRRYREAMPHARLAADLLTRSVNSDYGRQVEQEVSVLQHSIAAGLQQPPG